MPKVTAEHKERRKAQIIEAARRCFARHGYEGATVARLEAETGLSRGAIFNYFENKEALFVAVAAELSDRMTSILLEHGFRALLDAIVNEDPDWLAVQLESVRRARTDPEFQRQADEQQQVWSEAQEERLRRLEAQGIRGDVPPRDVGIFLSLVANGLALRVTTGDAIPDLDVLAELVDHGVAPRRARKEPSGWKTGPRTRRTPRSRRPSSAA